MAITQGYLKDLTYQINGAAIEVHKVLGPGLLESVYHKCLMKELLSVGISYESEVAVPIDYKGVVIYSDLRCDLFVEDCIVVELKAVQIMAPVHQAQLLTYMKLLKAPKGILYNFYCSNIIKGGQKTFVNEYFSCLDE